MRNLRFHDPSSAPPSNIRSQSGSRHLVPTRRMAHPRGRRHDLRHSGPGTVPWANTSCYRPRRRTYRSRMSIACLTRRSGSSSSNNAGGSRARTAPDRQPRHRVRDDIRGEQQPGGELLPASATLGDRPGAPSHSEVHARLRQRDCMARGRPSLVKPRSAWPPAPERAQHRPVYRVAWVLARPSSTG